MFVFIGPQKVLFFLKNICGLIPTRFFSYHVHKKDDPKFSDFYKSKRSTIRRLCNAHFCKVGLEIVEIIKKGTGDDEVHELKMSVISL